MNVSLIKKYKKGIFFLVFLLSFQVFQASLSGSYIEAASKLGKPKITIKNRTSDSVTIKIKKVKGATGYKIYYSKKKTGTYKYLASTTKRVYTDSGLSPNKVYYYKVKAYKSKNGKKIYSSFSKAKKAAKYAAQTTDTPSDTSSNVFSKEQQTLLGLVNKERTAAGLDALTLDSSICKAATTRATEIQTTFDHIRPDGSSCFTVLDPYGFAYSYAGENIAAGQTTPAAVMNSWMNSLGHKANILNKNFKKMGIGVVTSTDIYHYYWVQMFTD